LASDERIAALRQSLLENGGKDAMTMLAIYPLK
jgi:hypothetical protein